MSSAAGIRAGIVTMVEKAVETKTRAPGREHNANGYEIAGQRVVVVGGSFQHRERDTAM